MVYTRVYTTVGPAPGPAEIKESVFRQVGPLFRQVGSPFRQGILPPIPCPAPGAAASCVPRASNADSCGTAAAGSGAGHLCSHQYRHRLQRCGRRGPPAPTCCYAPTCAHNITSYIMFYSMVYIMLSGMVYIMLYGMVYTKSYLNSLLNRHSWNIARCWYRKITQQCSDICSFKSRQAVTKFSQGIPP